MRSHASLPLAAAASLTLAVVLGAASCGPTTQCAAICAAGCCDLNGLCQNGTLLAACGRGGAVCQACTGGTVCDNQQCVMPGAGGGAGGGSGGGSGGGTGGGSGGQVFAHPCTSDFEALDNAALMPFGRLSYAAVCAPFNKSLVLDRAELRERHAQCLEVRAEVSPGTGNYQVTRNGSGRISSVSWSPATGEGWSESFTYNSLGKLSSWSRNYSGATENRSESFTYNSAGRISSWSRSYSGSTENRSESFTYSSAGRISNWSRSYSGATENVSESFTYNSAGRVSVWSRGYSGATENRSESFTYNSTGRVSSWNRSYSGSTPNLSASITYDANGNATNLTTNGSGLTGAAVALCTP